MAAAQHRQAAKGVSKPEMQFAVLGQTEKVAVCDRSSEGEEAVLEMLSQVPKSHSFNESVLL
jgi:hypothetical protein